MLQGAVGLGAVQRQPARVSTVGEDPAAAGVALLLAAATPTRLALLLRLRTPAFSRDLCRELGLSRQALGKQLSALRSLGLVNVRLGRRSGRPAHLYCADAGALFQLRESIPQPGPDGQVAGAPTRPGSAAEGGGPRHGAGLLMVHGDHPGTWLPLVGSHWILGRGGASHVQLAYDPFVSSRHARIERGRDGPTVTDLFSTNGTRVNFIPLAAGGTAPLRSGDLLSAGRTHLLFREG